MQIGMEQVAFHVYELQLSCILLLNKLFFKYLMRWVIFQYSIFGNLPYFYHAIC